MNSKYLFALSVILFAIVANAQTGKTIPNGDFEIWDSTSYMALDSPWLSQYGLFVDKFGKGSATKVPGKAGSGVHLQTIAVGNSIIEGAILNNGTSYTQKPTGLSGYYRCNILSLDTAFIQVKFIKSGNVIAQELFPFTGIDTSSFKSFSFKFSDSLSITPDSLIICAYSSNLINYAGITTGSWLELDELSFTGPNVSMPIPNGDFESWSTVSLVNATGWQTAPLYSLLKGATNSGNGVLKSADSYTGKYCVELVSQPFGNCAPMTTGIYTPGFFPSGPFYNLTGGQPFNLQQDTLTGYYKYSPGPNLFGDSGSVSLDFQKGGNFVNSVSQSFGVASTWTYFELPFNISIVPDTMTVSFNPSLYFIPNGGSTLYLDDIQLKSQQIHTTGFKPEIAPTLAVKSFPDPAVDIINISFTGNIPGRLNIKLYDIEGRTLLNKDYYSANSLLMLPIDELKAGIYFYEVSAIGITNRGKFVKIL